MSCVSKELTFRSQRLINAGCCVTARSWPISRASAEVALGVGMGTCDGQAMARWLASTEPTWFGRSAVARVWAWAWERNVSPLQPRMVSRVIAKVLHRNGLRVAVLKAASVGRGSRDRNPGVPTCDGFPAAGIASALVATSWCISGDASRPTWSHVKELQPSPRFRLVSVPAQRCIHCPCHCLIASGSGDCLRRVPRGAASAARRRVSVRRIRGPCLNSGFWPAAQGGGEIGMALGTATAEGGQATPLGSALATPSRGSASTCARRPREAVHTRRRRGCSCVLMQLSNVRCAQVEACVGCGRPRYVRRCVVACCSTGWPGGAWRG